MRVLLTTDTIGGVWTFTRELTRELLRIGHAVALVSFGRVPSTEQRNWCSHVREQYPESFRFASSSAPLEWMNGNERAYADTSPLLLRVAGDFFPDVLHTNQFCFGRLPLPIPILITAHSDVLSWADSCCSEGLPSSVWLRRYRELVQDGLDGADAVVAPTRWMLSAIRNHFQLPSDQEVILNGRTLWGGERVEGRTLQAVTAGRLWDKAKNLEILKNINSPVPMLVAGEELLDRSTQLIQDSSMSLVGTLSDEELLDLFRKSSIYLAPSIYEPFGLAPLEAALCGCAVVANDIPSLREVWGAAALYFNDERTLSALLNFLYASPVALLEAQARSQKRAEQLSSARMTAAYCVRYERMIDAASKSHESLTHAC